MRTAAQLQRDAPDIHDAHDVAVLLGEKGHGARGDRVLIGHLPRLDGEVLPDVLVDLFFYMGERVIRDRAMMAEVEPQAVGRHDRAGLADVGAEHLAERRVHQMGRRMVALDVTASRLIDLGHRGRGLERFAESPDNGALAVHLLDIFDGQLPAVTFDHAGIADLTTGLGVERILL